MIPAEKLRMGSLKQRIKTPLSDGRTIIYVRIDHNVNVVKQHYENYLNRYRGAGLTKLKHRSGIKLDTSGFELL